MRKEKRQQLKENAYQGRNLLAHQNNPRNDYLMVRLLGYFKGSC